MIHMDKKLDFIIQKMQQIESAIQMSQVKNESDDDSVIMVRLKYNFLKFFCCASGKDATSKIYTLRMQMLMLEPY